jgi:hypothetical protein
MKAALAITAVLSFALVSPASAYALQSQSGKDGCGGDGSLCTVICDNGSTAGAMNWNGSVWTDNVKWDKDKDVEARKICEANGSSCT